MAEVEPSLGLHISPAFKALPNYGMYSSASKQKQNEEKMQTASALQYYWESAVSRKWRKLSSLPFIKKKKPGDRDSGFGYLAETQKYISRLRREVPDSQPKLPLKRSISVSQLQRPKARACREMYTFSYIGEVNGNIGILSTTIPISRPATSGMIARPNSPFYRRDVRARTCEGPSKSKEEISVQTETCENRSQEESICGWNGEEKRLKPMTPLISNERKANCPKVKAKRSQFERYLLGECPRKSLAKSTIKKRHSVYASNSL